MTKRELSERQSWPLEKKVLHSMLTIDTFVGRLGLDNVYLSFSGGKDSTVLSHLARRLFPDILHVFINTGNEYPDILRFVRQTRESGANITILRPRLSPRQVWERVGFPLVSKETSGMIHDVRTNPGSRLANKRLNGRFPIAMRWRYLIDEPYETDNACCEWLKKKPIARFERETGRHPMLGVMASESQLREKTYIRNGSCNVFSDSGGKTFSHPLAIWNDDDVWEYVRRYDVAIADIYRKGASRTGCVGCGFGATFRDDRRFELLREAYPKLYGMVMDYTNSGVTYRTALRKVLAVVGRYLPDERPLNLFDFDFEQPKDIKT